ncbi:MAG: hypothetical protein V1792_21830 [Pseudomonadota bacterium]
MQCLISELERAIYTLRTQREIESKAQRREALEASERITQETAEYLLDSGVFDAMEE